MSLFRDRGSSRRVNEGEEDPFPPSELTGETELAGDSDAPPSDGQHEDYAIEESDLSDEQDVDQIPPRPQHGSARRSSAGSTGYTPSDTRFGQTTKTETKSALHRPVSAAQRGATTPRTSTEELKMLFKRIHRYKPLDIDIDTKLKPFIPDFLPAVGDIDAFIKIPRPDHRMDELGLSVLDEPATVQSDPSILGLQLRAISKAPTFAPIQVRHIAADKVTKQPKLIDDWIRSVKDLHNAKPPDQVRYTRRMPDVDALMQEWPKGFETLLDKLTLPTAILDVSLREYIEIVCALLDMPVYDHRIETAKPPKQSSKQSSAMIESLHAIFTLYTAFKTSTHFNQPTQMI